MTAVTCRWKIVLLLVSPHKNLAHEMQHAQLLAIVRRHVRAAFTARCVEDLDDCCETILIRDGFYCGRCFAYDSHRAIWFVEEKVIKFYGPDGDFLFLQPIGELDNAAAA